MRAAALRGLVAAGGLFGEQHAQAVLEFEFFEVDIERFVGLRRFCRRVGFCRFAGCRRLVPSFGGLRWSRLYVERSRNGKRGKACGK